MQCAGEEAAIVGSAAAMLPSDEIFGQYVSAPQSLMLLSALIFPFLARVVRID